MSLATLSGMEFFVRNNYILVCCPSYREYNEVIPVFSVSVSVSVALLSILFAISAI